MLDQIRRVRQDESGFTLIELLIVIVVLGVLSTVVVFAVGGIKDRADIEEYHRILTTKFLLDYPLPTVAGMRTVLDDLGAKNPKIRELKPENLIDTRFLQQLKDSGVVK